MPYESTNARDVGLNLQINSLLRRWTDVVTVNDFDPGNLPDDDALIDRSFQLEAFLSVDAIPDFGEPHPVYKNTYCTSVDIQPFDKSSTSIRAYVTWETPNVDANNKPRNQVRYDFYQTQQIKNYDINGELTIVFYIGDKATGVAKDMAYVPRIADVRIPRSMRTIRVTQYEDLSEGGLTAKQVSNNQMDLGALNLMAAYNEDAIWGFSPAELLFIGRHAQSDGTPLHRCEYNFLINELGWDKFFAVYLNQNGLIPPDVAKISNPKELKPGGEMPNGVGVFDMLPKVSFSGFFSNIILPGESD